MFCHWKSNKPHRGDSLVEARVSFEMSPVGATINKEHMANTYSQISIHAVFAVKGRDNIILNTWRDLHKYISGIITGNGGKSLAVGGWKDHVNIFFRFACHIQHF